MRQITSRQVLEAGFTLLELLLATALVTVVMIVLLSLTTRTAEVTDSSRARMQSEGGLRGALDRLSADFSGGVFRDDLPVEFSKQNGNDSFTFTTAAEGYGGKRGITRVAYRVQDGNLERGAQGSDWINPPLEFGGGPVPPVADADYDQLAERVFRMEVDFLLSNGTIVSSPAPTSWENVRAVIVTLASIDERALLRVDGEAADLESLFPDPPAVDARSAERWLAQLEDPSLFPGGAPPTPILQGLNVRQRIFPIRR